MAEESQTDPCTSERMEDEAAAPSTSTDQTDSVDVDGEAKKLLGLGNRHLVMGDIPAAINAFQEASSLLGKKYGETADECGEAFFLYGKSLLELARMENSVLGNALEGVPEDENGESDSRLQNTEDLNEEERQDLREQVYDAMGEAEDITPDPKTKSEKKAAEEGSNIGELEAVQNNEERDTLLAANAERVAEDLPEQGEVVAEISEPKELLDTAEEAAEKPADYTQGMAASSKPKEDEAIPANEETSYDTRISMTDAPPSDRDPSPKHERIERTKVESSIALVNGSEASPTEGEVIPGESSRATGEVSVSNADEEKPEMASNAEEKGGEENEQMEEEDESEEDKDYEATEDKENDEVGNLQLAWEMLELAKVIYGRKNDKEAQLRAAEAHLKLGEVSMETENFSQAIEDFQACLTLQKQHLEAHDRLLAETHYQLGLAYHYSNQNQEAVLQFTESMGVIEKRMAVLMEQIVKSEGDSAAEHKKEMEELKELLPEIKEKIEDAKDAQKSGKVSELALKETLIPMKRADGAASSNGASDISHLVRKKAKEQTQTRARRSVESTA
ncbi:nuclear autoantigenic sperm protein isoform X2 [Rhinatrema bivittatum]|uniref:nuclear autoantigenic sperm protein isoform X2 n=1 Tax=Rhinatrema bivittatum TaxID=194408 RepID=UPI0011275948|nr:nuclear autoantigenic sperm protein isoform X2 [Rhinatrema bivittatum]